MSLDVVCAYNGCNCLFRQEDQKDLMSYNHRKNRKTTMVHVKKGISDSGGWHVLGEPLKCIVPVSMAAALSPSEMTTVYFKSTNSVWVELIDTSA